MSCCGPQSHEFHPPLFHSSVEEKDEALNAEIVNFYATTCDHYRTKPRASVIVCYRYRTSTFKAERTFQDIDMLALADVMIKYRKASKHIRCVDLSYSNVSIHGIVALSQVIKINHNLLSIHLHNLKISPMGAEALALALRDNTSIRYVDMRACRIGQDGGKHIAKHVLSSEITALKEMDLSVNNIGNESLLMLRQAARDRKKMRELDENVVATTYLLGRASDYGISEYIAAAMYSSSLLLLYMSSTLYHAFFCCKATNRVFQVLDHSAIYLLIAGTYTPVLILALPENHWSTPLLFFQWISCFTGILIEFVEFTGKVQVTLIMYVMMGWSVIVCFQDLTSNLPGEGIFWLVVGGVFYTGGVPFFIAQFYMSHVIWHMFVLVGSICQWWAVYQHVMPLDMRNSKGQNMAFAQGMKEEFGHVVVKLSEGTMETCSRTINTCANILSSGLHDL
ncbi:hypothetical protein AAMO2058_000338300 [Amorphochlora amoebiformis]